MPQARRFHQSQAQYRFCLGGNRCLGPDTIIEGRRVSEITSSHIVRSWNGASIVESLASKPWIKGYEQCYRIYLSNGEWFDASAAHRVLTDCGYVSIGALSDSALSILAPFRDAATQIVFQVLPITRIKFQVIDAIIAANSIYMMNDLAAFQVSAKVLLHYQPMLENVFLPWFWSKRMTGAIDADISLFRHKPATLPFGMTWAAAGRFAGNELNSACIVSILSDWAKTSILTQFPCASSLLPRPIGESSQHSIFDHFPSPALISPDGFASIVSYAEIGVKPIYDFEVPGLCNYVAAGIVHHNSSKSHANAHELAMLALDRQPWRRMPRPINAWYATQTYEMVGSIVWPKLERLFPLLGL